MREKWSQNDVEVVRRMSQRRVNDPQKMSKLPHLAVAAGAKVLAEVLAVPEPADVRRVDREPAAGTTVALTH